MPQDHTGGPWIGSAIGANTSVVCPVCGLPFQTPFSACPNCASIKIWQDQQNTYYQQIQPRTSTSGMSWFPPATLSPTALFLVLWVGSGAIQTFECDSSEKALEKVRELQETVRGTIKLLEVTHVWNQEWKHEETRV